MRGDDRAELMVNKTLKGSNTVKPVATLIAAAFMGASATIALAQGVRGALVLAPEERTVVKKYVTSHKSRSGKFLSRMNRM